jgi:hypothetical protein
MAFSYREEPGKSVVVLIDGRVVGHILNTRGGYVYAPKGSTLRGETLPTVPEVKRSLEAA